MSGKLINGMPVFDAKRSVKLTVSERDIAYADIKEPHNCAVARACKRELAVQEARAHLSRIYLRTNSGSWTRYETPKNMRTEIIAFDRGGKFEPGEYVLAKVSHPLGKRTGGEAKAKAKVKARAKTKRAPPHVVQDVRVGPA